MGKERHVVAVGMDADRRARLESAWEGSGQGSYRMESIEALDVSSGRRLDADILVIGTREQVGSMDAISYARLLSLVPRHPQVIFVDTDPSSSPDVYQADHAYLLPHDFDESQAVSALRRAEELLRASDELPIRVRTRSSEYVISPRRIRYVESNRRVLTFHLVEGSVQAYGKLSDLGRLLPARFVQCHKSFLVNLEYLEELQRDYAVLVGGERVPVSQRRHALVREALSAHVGGPL